MKRTVCLNMIVKDEAHVIRRCLVSVRPFIDTWVIVDTGSTDGTQDVIRDALKDVPGELHERPWKDFGSNRSEAIQLAAGRADYLLIIDADDRLVIPDDYQLPALQDDAYSLLIRYGNIEYQRPVLIREALRWSFKGVLHEYLDSVTPASQTTLLSGPYMQIIGDGRRSQLDTMTKYARDAEVLEKALAEDPDNARHVFYLAQSYRDCGQLEKSLEAYDRRAAMVGFVEETYCAMLQAARIARRIGRPPAEVMDRYLAAHESRPSRAEAIGELAVYCREIGQRWTLGYLFAQRALKIPPSTDVLFVEPEWTAWRCLDEFAVSAYWVGEYAESRDACERLLVGGLLPPEHRERVLANSDHARKKLSLNRPAPWNTTGALRAA